MSSPYCERAIADALRAGRALLKFVSPNDAGVTRSHQRGFYLPVGAWEMFSPQPPVDGINHKHPVQILWQDGRTTASAVTWYGRGTRHEYRLTKFGRDFPFLTPDAVGNLLVLVPESPERFRAYLLDHEEDIDDLQAALGVEVIDTWGIYEFGAVRVETEGECIDRQFRAFAANVESFPTGAAFSAAARDALIECIADFARNPTDAQLLRAVEAEYTLFRIVERRLCEPEIQRLFESVDDFLKTAASVMNRRKSRAGRSFENQMEFILAGAGIPFEARPDIDGRPDVVIPSAAAYRDQSYPVERLFVVGLKTTCKDRWRQILNEGTRVPGKHLITMQRGISRNQLAEMAAARVCLVVPEALHSQYPPGSPMTLRSVDQFIAEVKRTIPA